jgi:hypothetical protein
MLNIVRFLNILSKLSNFSQIIGNLVARQNNSNTEEMIEFIFKLL